MPEINRARQVANLGAELVSVKDFGAKGDGTTNDTTNWQAAVDYCVTNNIELFVPNGTYLLDSMRTLANGTHIRGESKYNTIVKLSADTDGQTKLFLGEALSDVHISNLTVDTDYLVNTTARGVFTINFTTGGDNIVFRDIYIPGSTSGAFFIDKTSNVEVSNCEIANCSSDPIRISSTGADGIVVKNNHIHSMTNMPADTRGIQIGTAVNFIVTDNIIENISPADTMALDFGGSSRGVVSNNIIRDCYSIVDLENTASNISFSNNVCAASATAGYGYYFLEKPTTETCEKITITGGSVQGFKRGIHAEGVRKLTISGVSVIDSGEYGIYITDGSLSSKVSDDVNITGCTVMDSGGDLAATYDGILVKADRGLVTGNFVRSSNTLNDINTHSANTVVLVHGNNATTVTRGETRRYIQLSSAKIFEGSTNPEGTITADPGDMYLRSTGGSATTLYIKESGTSNTGWIGK